MKKIAFADSSAAEQCVRRSTAEMTNDSLNTAGEETRENEPSVLTATEGSETAQRSQLWSAFDH